MSTRDMDEGCLPNILILLNGCSVTLFLKDAVPTRESSLIREFHGVLHTDVVTVRYIRLGSGRSFNYFSEIIVADTEGHPSSEI